jgi:succinyl-diaminopimelate desuccinylase
MSTTLDLAKQLIALPSITPDDGGCQQLLAHRLTAMGFTVESLPFGPVSNLWAITAGDGPLFVFAGHTDVVPPGPLKQWKFDPFTPTEHDNCLYGRGAADMKSSLAAMITAAERVLTNRTLNGRLAFLITSDEEGEAVDGTRAVMDLLKTRGIKIDYCLVGEPSSSKRLGDTIKIGRRGSLNGKLKLRGVQGHVAYPQLAANPIHQALPALSELSQMQWDAGNASFPPTSFQISNMKAGTGANNVIPEVMEIEFNLRYSTQLDAETIKTRVQDCLDRHGLTENEFSYDIDWQLSGKPFLTATGSLIDVVCESIESVTGNVVERSTAGGTSDGRFIAPMGAELVELGPVNTTIHKVNEHTNIQELENLSEIYQLILERML